MKYISIQIQPDRDESANKDEAISILTSAGFTPEIQEGEDDGKYINLNIKSDNLKDTWAKIKDSLINLSQYSKSSIVVCEGSEGWDNYLLLHHYDSSQTTDEI